MNEKHFVQDHRVAIVGGPLATEREAWSAGRQRLLEQLRHTPPRPWAAMLETWGRLLASLCVVAGPSSPFQERGGEPLARLAPVPRWLRVWEMMWMLQPCGEARKAAFTLGAAALLIERWRTAPTCHHIPSHAPDPEPIGQRAEALLRIAVWHIEDARGEAHARTLGHEPTIPPHERVYTTDADAYDRYGGLWCSGATDGSLAQAILVDHFAIRSNVGIRRWGDAGMTAFAETAIESLPSGPWVITSRDVARFLDMILGDDPHSTAEGDQVDATDRCDVCGAAADDLHNHFIHAQSEVA